MEKQKFLRAFWQLAKPYWVSEQRGKGLALLAAVVGLLPGAVIETNFDPGHDRRLRKLLEGTAGAFGLGIPAGGALLLGPAGTFEAVGTVFRLTGSEGDLEPLVDETSAGGGEPDASVD